MRFNWGYGILVVIILFLIGLGTMVFISMREKNSIELIEEKYYEKELVFQDQIDAQNNLAALYPDSLNIADTNGVVFIKLPSKAARVDSGYVEFIRPSDKTKDRRIALHVNESGELSLPKSNFVPGLYKFRIGWSTDGINYVKTKDFIVK